MVSNHEPLDELMAPWKFFVPVEGYWGDVVTEEETFDYLSFKKDENGVWHHWVEWDYNPDGWWESNDFKLKSLETKGHSEEDSDMVSRTRKGDIENLNLSFNIPFILKQMVEGDSLYRAPECFQIDWHE